MLQPDMHQTIKESAGANNYRTRVKPYPCLRDYAASFTVFDDQIIGRHLEYGKVLLRLNAPAHLPPIKLPVNLRARCVYSRTFRAIQNTELNACGICHLSHGSAQSIKFFNEVSLADATDRWIAGKLPDSVEIMRNKKSLSSHARSSKRSFSTRMSATDDDDLVAFWVFHSFQIQSL